MSVRISATALLVAALTAAWPCAAAEPAPVQADVGLRSDRTVVLAAQRAGTRAVAVGERGAVFVSGDGGATWHGRRVSSTRTLTSVIALDELNWIAAGHGGVLFRSQDGGENWNAVVGDGGTDSFIGLTPVDDHTVLAYGAFGMLLRSTDAGRTWTRSRVIDEDFDRHINRIVVLANSDLLLLGESGAIARSSDGGQTFAALESPYGGSFFGGMQTASGSLLIFGMRGRVYRSDDSGKTWEPAQIKTEIPFFGGASLDNGTVVLSGNAGWIASSRDDGRSFTLEKVGGKGISGVFERPDHVVVGFGAQGLRPLPATIGERL
ncbi:hypothetical protein [Azoarcus sp. KH32C]|uniref:hypothetical protein n=1 Tax=Azoarcus sp. KH32C TaxID=748247 RepID=UPI0002386955|nr:hypothetical protein [Azoarcus sp. KH32C]BAL24800.1 hypothetical protein AZKH_2494 [Azoarcus sp. KH32C]